MTSEERSAIAPSTGKPIPLDYAGQINPRRRLSLPQLRRICAVAGIISLLVGLLAWEDIGSGRFILNPVRILAAGAVCVAACVHVAVRVLEEKHIPGWSRAASIACAWSAIGLIPLAYHGWNRWRSHRWLFALHDERFVGPLSALLATVAIFAVLRMYLWRYRRRSGVTLEAGPEASANAPD